MKKRCFVFILAVIIATFSSVVCYADNPVVQTVFTADPAPMVYNGTLYLYNSHDEDNADSTFVMKDWRCYSTTDMVNWTDHGVILNTQQVSWSQGGAAYAGQCVARNGKFYWYFPTTCTTDPGFAIGVAVSNSPTGPFTDIGHPLIYPSMTNAATHGWSDIDPTVVVDDDGQAYMYWGNNMCYWVKLNSDMVSISGSPTNVPLTTAALGPDYEEGPWFWKHGGHYYLAYCSGIPESIHYSMATSPTGPWTYKGRLMAVQTDSMGNQAGITDYKGNSYFFGFNQALPNGGTYKRSVCVKKFTYNADGTIPEIPQGFPSTDTAQLGTLNPFVQTEAETICWESGVETETCSEGGMNVGYIDNGDYIKVKGVNFGSGADSFEARVASAANGGSIELRLDSPTGTLVGTCAVSGTGGWQAWTTKTCPVSGATGTHDLYLKFTGGSGSLFNMNWWKFNPSNNGTTIVSGKTYKLINRNSGKLLDVDNSSTADGANVLQWADNGGNNQKWVATSTSNGYTLKNVNSGKLLDVDNSSTADGGNVLQWIDNGGSNQRWNIVDVGNGYYKVLNVKSGKALDVDSSSTANGANVMQWSDNGGNDQQWQFVQTN